MKKIKLLMGMGLILVMLLSACQGISVNIPGLSQPTTTPTLQAGTDNELTPTPDVEATSAATVEPITSLTLWIPPEMDQNRERKRAKSWVSGCSCSPT